MGQRKIIMMFFSVCVVLLCIWMVFFFIHDKFFYKQVNNILQSARENLVQVTQKSEKSTEVSFQPLLNDYTREIMEALEKAKSITNEEMSQQVFMQIFKQISSQAVLFEVLKTRPNFFGLGLLDQTQDSNITVQEDALVQLSLLSDQKKNDSIQEKPSNTKEALKCPNCNVVLISLTTLRKDRIGIYGYDKPTTPNIDRFFDTALRFNNTMAPTSWTTPDAVSLFTSLFPYRHGIMRRDASTPYNRKVMTLAELLIKNGYQTGAFTGGGDYNNRYSGVDRGFYDYLDETNYESKGIPTYSLGGGGTLRYAKLSSLLPFSLKWLGENVHKKFFLFLQGYDTHCPLEPHEPFASQFTTGLQSDFNFTYCHWTHEDTEPSYENGKKYWNVQIPVDRQEEELYVEKFFQSDLDYMNALYDARVAEIDSALESFFTQFHTLGLDENTIVILMADHGEMLGEHGRFMRGGSIHGTMYEQAIGFPLLIKHPKIKEPIIVDDIVQTVDLMPTILSLLDVRDPQSAIREGNSLNLSIFVDQPTNQYGFGGIRYVPVFVNDIFNKTTEVNSIRNDIWKLMKDSIYKEDGVTEESISYRLFNIKDDPNEEKNVYDVEREEAEKLKAKLEQWLDHYR